MFELIGDVCADCRTLRGLDCIFIHYSEDGLDGSCRERSGKGGSSIKCLSVCPSPDSLSGYAAISNLNFLLEKEVLQTESCEKMVP